MGVSAPGRLGPACGRWAEKKRDVSPPEKLSPPGGSLGLWGLLTLSGVYIVAGKLGLMLAFVHASATAVWPPTGIALAAMLLFGSRVWPAIFFGAFVVNVTTAGSTVTSLGIALGNTLEGLLGAYLVTRFAGGSAAFDHARDIFRFGALTSLVSTPVSATIGVTSLALAGYASWPSFGAIWLTWWLGDVAGALVVAPPLILWSRRRRGPREAAGVVGLALLHAAVVLLGWAVFSGLAAPWIRNHPLEFLCIPPLVWAAFYFGQRAAATSIALLSGIATWGTLQGFGPFVRASQNESLLLLQAFMATLALTILPLAAVVRERVRAEEALARAAAIVESSDDAIIGKTLDGVITSWNRGAERLYGYRTRDAVGRSIGLIIPPELDDELPGILERIRQGEPVEPFETVRLRRDGTRVEVSVTVSPTRDSRGRIVGASTIARDITLRKEAEAARRERDVLRGVAGVAATASHEINNPLAIVMGQAQLLSKELRGAGERGRIDEILGAVWRIQEIVARMRHINRIVLVEESQHVPVMLDLAKSSPPPDPVDRG